MRNTQEEIYIKNVENAIRGIRLNTKKPIDVSDTVESNINKLKSLNDGMATDLLRKYDKVINDFKNRKYA
jgi:hypothetical protein